MEKEKLFMRFQKFFRSVTVSSWVRVVLCGVETTAVVEAASAPDAGALGAASAVEAFASFSSQKSHEWIRGGGRSFWSSAVRVSRPLASGEREASASDGLEALTGSFKIASDIACAWIDQSTSYGVSVCG